MPGGGEGPRHPSISGRAMAASAAIVPGRVHAIGDLVDVDGRISWFAPDARGLAPVNSYALVEDDGVLVIDTGVPIHERAVIDQLAALLPPGAPVGILHTRIPEYDSFGNTASLVRALGVDRIYAHFPAQGWIHYRPVHDRPGVDPAELWPDRPIEFLTPLPGDTIAVGRGGGRVVELIGAPLRILATYWVYDRDTRTLFTSDAFGHVLLRDAAEPRIVEPDADEASYEDVRSHLLGKFDWLGQADTTPLRRELARIFDAYDVETIAPGFGRVLRGRDVVARHVELVDRALGEVGVSPVGAGR